MLFYEGPSMLDGSPIVAIATRGSANRKTGAMIQTWILRSDMHPVEAVQTKADAAICGGCRHRGTTCYVNIGQAPAAVYRAYKRGRYQRGALPFDAPVRMGAYGDPVAVPWEAWAPVLQAPKRTGYTHQWRSPKAAPFRGHLQASCDSPMEAFEAALAGWKTFIVQPHDALREPDFEDQLKTVECLNSTHGVSCATCAVCDGTKAHVWIRAHGTRARSFA